ncbi:MAG TPA: hypothetical protein VK436_01395 [Methanocella sp.]|nr:hypothetical protein [Methanocella sp.]
MQSGDEFTITRIPDGNYIVYYRIGTDWDSDTDKIHPTGAERALRGYTELRDHQR